jgi:hypothetical protein
MTADEQRGDPGRPVRRGRAAHRRSSSAATCATAVPGSASISASARHLPADETAVTVRCMTAPARAYRAGQVPGGPGTAFLLVMTRGSR